MVGKRFRYKKMEIWAENGFVRMEDQDDGEYLTLTRREAIQRAIAINQSIIDLWPSERDEANRLVDNLMGVIKDAKNQGDPMDPVVMDQMVREVRRSRRAGRSNILLPSGNITGTELKDLSTFQPTTSKIELV